MTTREAILSEMSEIFELISAARGRLAQNELIMIKDINGRVQGMVESITELPPEQAVELRPPLVSLLEDFKSFSEQMQRKIAEISEADTTKEDTGA
ncbi:MAG: hypothetical protein OEU46_07815 [Alphaproteobacteria bacterium]|nr:hypothetical protein [Alphaproteobacteria bacterium]